MKKKSNILIKRFFALFINLSILIFFLILSYFFVGVIKVRLTQFFYEDTILQTRNYFSDFQRIILSLAEPMIFLVSLLLFFLFNLNFYTKSKRNLGKIIFNLAVVKTNNLTPSLFDILLKRNAVILFSVIAPIFIMSVLGSLFSPHYIEWPWVLISIFFFNLVDYLFIFRKDRRCIHDLIAGTKVVYFSKKIPRASQYIDKK